MCNVNVYTTGSEKTSTGRVGWRRACRPPACRRPPPGARARTPSGLTAPARTASSAAARSPEHVIISIHFLEVTEKLSGYSANFGIKIYSCKQYLQVFILFSVITKILLIRFATKTTCNWLSTRMKHSFLVQKSLLFYINIL